MFEDLLDKPVLAQFDQPESSSDGGAILLKARDQTWGLSAAFAGCLHDERDPQRVVHSMANLIMQRVYGLACGYEDCNDTARLADDPIQQLMAGHDAGQSLASQPTLSRFENQADARSLIRRGHALMERVVARHRKRLRKRVKRITIDLDPPIRRPTAVSN